MSDKAKYGFIWSNGYLCYKLESGHPGSTYGYIDGRSRTDTYWFTFWVASAHDEEIASTFDTYCTDKDAAKRYVETIIRLES